MQRRVAAFDAQRFQSLGPGYVALSLAGEAGELANVMKKLWRVDPRVGLPDGFAVLPPADKQRIADELADVLLMSLVLANHMEIDVEGAIASKLEVIDERLGTGHYRNEAKGPHPDS